jgi:hypothetical protein
MKKNLKKVIMSLLAVVMIFGTITSTKAQAAEGPCAYGNGTCIMDVQGWGNLYYPDGSVALRNANFYKCRNCGGWVCTSGYPHFSGYMVGDYATAGTFAVNKSGSMVSGKLYKYSMSGYTSSATLPGFKFR